MRTPLDLAVRIFPVVERVNPLSLRSKRRKCPGAWLVMDMETRTDETQRLTFGSYRFFESRKLVREGLIYADDVSSNEQRLLERYAATHGLPLLSRDEFADQFFQDVYRGRCLLIGFNLPFDISRIARDWGIARGRFAGGFSFDLWSYQNSEGQECSDRYRPRIRIKHIDNKRALKGFTSRKNPDKDDLIPEGSDSGEAESGYIFRGHFLDLRTLAFALTDQSYTLESACKAFGVEHGKQSVQEHGKITNNYIDYNRRDVLATAELAQKLIDEFEKHPIALQATKAYSPASIGKAYLRAMGILPILERQPVFPADILGYSSTAFFGGRTSTHIRKVPVPVVYTDFLSMYPTVNSLMGLWRFVVASKIEVRRNCIEEVNAFLRGVTASKLFEQEIWQSLTAFVKVVPDGDILPTRAKYSHSSNDWQVAVNYLYLQPDETDQGLWYSLPDVAASVILAGKVPRVVDAFILEPQGIASGLNPTKLNGQVDVDPASDDFFRTIIEQRRLIQTVTNAAEENRKRLDRSLKVLANATSYGIYAEMIRQESDEQIDVICHGIDEQPFKCRAAHAEFPGEYCFPPLASLITGAARLMLALLEHFVSELGGTYAMEDTDSMAIVATRRGGFVECEGGRVSKGGKRGIKALSWEQVEQIAGRFASLNPYDRKAVPGSILKIEDDNFDPSTGEQRQLYCLSISAKRYALFLREMSGEPHLLRSALNNKTDRWSQHGLGHLLNPTDPQSQDRKWLAQVWVNLIGRALGFRARKTTYGKFPAVARVSITSPVVMRPFAAFNAGKSFSQRIKPFNFLLTCQVRAFGFPKGSDPERFHLVAPYTPDPSMWSRIQWIDQYTGELFHVSIEGHHGEQSLARVKTYDEILEEYEFHPESKCCDSDAVVCGRATVGLLSRRHVSVRRIRFIGKESNLLEGVEAGLVHSANEAYTEYHDPRRSEWQTSILPRLKAARLCVLVAKTGLSKRALINLRAGRSLSHTKNQELIVAALKEMEEGSSK